MAGILGGDGRVTLVIDSRALLAHGSGHMIDVVCGIIQDGQGHFLACLRPQGKHLGGCWEFPGGKVDPGESPQTALARELLEELEITVHVGSALDSVEFHYQATSIHLMPYLCEIVRGTPNPTEHEEIRWCAIDDFDSLNWAEADIPILRQIERSAI